MRGERIRRKPAGHQCGHTKSSDFEDDLPGGRRSESLMSARNCCQCGAGQCAKSGWPRRRSCCQAKKTSTAAM